MNEGLTRFRKLFLTDETFQNELQAVAKDFAEGQSEEELFRDVISPLAARYGITATFDEFKAYLESLNEDRELDSEEIEQIAGGGTKGVGFQACLVVGVGLGGMEEDGEGTDIKGYCVGLGAGSTGACAGHGSST